MHTVRFGRVDSFKDKGLPRVYATSDELTDSIRCGTAFAGCGESSQGSSLETTPGHTTRVLGRQTAHW